MTAFSNISDIVSALTTSGRQELIPQFYDNRSGAAAATALIAGRLASLWTYNQIPSGTGAAPGAVAAPTRATVGALGQANPGGGREKFLLGVATTSTVAGVYMVYDRLLHISGLSGTTTTAQTVGGSLTRYTSATDAIGNMIYIEIYNTIGTTATTITASYSNEGGTSGRTTKAVAIGGTNLREISRMIPLPLQDGDLGVTAVASVTLAASTTTAGDFGVTVGHPLLFIPIALAGTGATRDTLAGIPSIVKVQTDACLTGAWMPTATGAPQLLSHLSFAEN